jgi:predicted metal-dependent phosphoesterase TrpH
MIHYDVFPKVIKAGQRETITIRPLFEHSRFIEEATYQVVIYPREEIGYTDGFATASSPIVEMSLQPEAGVLRVQGEFPGEQEYLVLVTPPADKKKPRPLEFRVYALQADLFERRPYKGDFHLHSFRSDGREAPAVVAAACRRIGIDFLAITDHHHYEPSLEAIQAFEGLPIDLRIYPGEEIHPPDNRIHMINFGGQHSINDLFSGEAYQAEVSEIEAGLTGLPAGPLRYQYASCLWVFAKIRQAGGLAIFCHPYWVFDRRYNVPEALIARHFEELPFDAFELIGGMHRPEVESNLLQVARYHEMRAQGKYIPILGASDAHGCDSSDLFGWYYTIAFAASTALPDLIASVKDCWAVAVDALPGETARAHGPFRLVKFTHFLLREVLPMHDELCVEEGQLMLAYLAGEEGAAEGLRRLQGQTVALYDHLWARR